MLLIAGWWAGGKFGQRTAN